MFPLSCARERPHYVLFPGAAIFFNFFYKQNFIKKIQIVNN